MPKKRSVGDEADALIASFHEGFVNGSMKVAQAQWIVEQLDDLIDEALPRLVQLLEAPDEESRQVAIALLRELEEPRAIPALRRMLRNPDYTDLEKMTVIQTLEELGVPIDDAMFQRAISDPEAMMELARSHMLENIEDPVYLETFLEMILEGPPEAQEEYVFEILAPMEERRLLRLLTALLHSPEDDVVLAAIDAIERLKEPATIPSLEERAEYDPSRRVRYAAQNAALRLQTRVGDRPAHSWITPPALPLVHCLLSTIDGSGGQVLFVARERPDGDLQTLDLMFNDHQGIKDCFSVAVNETELDDMIAAFDTIEFVDVSLERARTVVDYAYQVTLEAKRRLPPTLLAWQGWMEGEDLRQMEEFPLPFLETSRQPDLLADSEELMDLDEFDSWFFNPDEVEDSIPRYRRLRRKTQTVAGEVDEDSYEALLGEALEALLDEAYQHLLSRRLRHQAWLLAQIYEDREVSLWALAAAAALEDGVVAEHPLLQAMMDVSFLNAAG